MKLLPLSVASLCAQSPALSFFLSIARHSGFMVWYSRHAAQRQKLRSNALGQARAAVRKEAGEDAAKPVIKQLEATDAALKALDNEASQQSKRSRKQSGKGKGKGQAVDDGNIETLPADAGQRVQEARAAAASLQSELERLTPESEVEEAEAARKEATQANGGDDKSESDAAGGIGEDTQADGVG